MRYAPPQKKSITYKFRKNLIASAVTFAFSTLTVCAATVDVIDEDFLKNDGDNGQFTEYRTDIKESGVYDSINLPQSPKCSESICSKSFKRRRSHYYRKNIY